MCPVEVRLSNSDQQSEKQSEDSFLETDFNNLDDNVDKSMNLKK